MSQYNGLLIVDKPGRTHNAVEPQLKIESESVATPPDASRGLPTSHDVVQQIRRWSKERRIGHTGTLDPMASGVLVLCLGVATRLVEYYQRHDKAYYAEIVLGAATDTYDAMGRVTHQAPVPLLNTEQVDAVLDQFRGQIQQLPPIYSALKVQGESLHRKARRGETVIVQPRDVTFHELTLLALEPPNRICLHIVCSAGAYVRSLAHDLGQALNSHAYLDVLRRESAGPFTLTDAHTLEQVETAIQQQHFDQLLLPPGVRLALPKLTVEHELLIRLGHGQKTPLAQADSVQAAHAFPADTEQQTPLSNLAQIYSTAGEFAGIVRCLGPAQSNNVDSAAESAHPAYIWKAEKWFFNAGIDS